MNVYLYTAHITSCLMVVYNSILSVYITSGMDLTQVNEMYNCYFFLRGILPAVQSGNKTKE